MSAPIVSIIVPTYKRPRWLEACLRSIETTVTIPHEVICVHVQGDDESQEVLFKHKVQTISQPTRGGAVQAMNMGLAAAKGEFVTQINDDCELLPHSIANAVRFLQAPANSRIGQAAFFHDSPVRRNVHAQIQVEGIWYFVCHVRGLCFANFGLTRRELHEQLGHLDERYFMYGADPDFSLKVWHEAKLAVEPCPGALVHHAELIDERAQTERSQQREDNQKLFTKWDLD